jgi:hypothetical protein
MNMTTEQSQFSKFSKKQLLFIVEKLIDEDFPIGNPYDVNYDEAYSILGEISKYFGIKPTQEDVEFFSKLLEINDDVLAELFANNKEQRNNKELIEKLVIPIAKSYNLNYEVWGTCSWSDYKVQEFDCYDKNWVDDYARQQLSDGNWELWNGQERKSTEFDNFEESNWEFGDVREVNHEPIKESILSKLVLENTSDVINSLDRTTLIKLRNLINQKLSS